METSGESDLFAQGMGTTEPVSNVGILGCRVSKVTLSAAVGLIEEWIQRPAQRATLCSGDWFSWSMGGTEGS